MGEITSVFKLTVVVVQGAPDVVHSVSPKGEIEKRKSNGFSVKSKVVVLTAPEDVIPLIVMG